MSSSDRFPLKKKRGKINNILEQMKAANWRSELKRGCRERRVQTSSDHLIGPCKEKRGGQQRTGGGEGGIPVPKSTT